MRWVAVERLSVVHREFTMQDDEGIALLQASAELDEALSSARKQRRLVCLCFLAAHEAESIALAPALQPLRNAFRSVDFYKLDFYRADKPLRERCHVALAPTIVLLRGDGTIVSNHAGPSLATDERLLRALLSDHGAKAGTGERPLLPQQARWQSYQQQQWPAKYEPEALPQMPPPPSCRDAHTFHLRGDVPPPTGWHANMMVDLLAIDPTIGVRIRPALAKELCP